MTPENELIDINKHFIGQDAIAVVAVNLGYKDENGRPFAIGDDTTTLDANKLLGDGPGDGSVIISIIRALFDLLSGLGVNCAPQTAAQRYRNRGALQRSIMRNRLERKLRRVSRSAADDTDRLFSLIEDRNDQHSDERLALGMTEVNNASNDLF